MPMEESVGALEVVHLVVLTSISTDDIVDVQRPFVEAHNISAGDL